MNQILAPLQYENYVDAEAVREDERQRIARDIHDELGQQTLVLHMDLVKLCGNIHQMQPELQEAMNLVMKQLGVVMQSLRTTIRGLRPAVLDRGFSSAVEWQCEQFSIRFGVACSLALSAGDIRLPNGKSLVLFRALQEALNNVHRHARATHVCVTVSVDASSIALTVVDDGVGMASGNQIKADSYGLAGLKERIIALGGKVNICSGKNQGTSLSISLPI